MYQLIAVLKPFRVAAVLQALETIDVLALTVREVKGFGRQKTRLPLYLGSEFNDSFLPKVELTLYVREEDVPAAERAVVQQARTGRMGDGKVVLIRGLEDYVVW